MTNKDFIEKYKNENVVLSSKYVKKSQDHSVISGIVNPYELDFRQLCSPTDNQLTEPHCAGFAAAQLMESIYWKQNGVPIQLDANQIYAKAKEIDGKPDMNGTHPEYTLRAALKLCSSLINSSHFDAKTFYTLTNPSETITYVRYLVHKFIFLVGGFKITQSWHKVNRFFYTIKRDDRYIGTHACLICGYDREGFLIQNSWGKGWGRKGFARISNDVFVKQFVCASYLDFAKPNV